MFVIGGGSMLLSTILNLGVQLSAPRWVTARALSLFQSALTGGVAFGSWIWGRVARDHGVGPAIIMAGCALIAMPLLGRVWPLPNVLGAESEPLDQTRDPEVVLAITLRSGPVVLELDYDVDPAQARQFYDTMLKVQSARQRNGAFDWSLSRDIGNPAVWTERYICPTWGDYLRLRSRFTHSDRVLQDEADNFHRPGGAVRLRRRLERPFGSVRWAADTPDVPTEPVITFTP
jgi:hypothetical protein